MKYKYLLISLMSLLFVGCKDYLNLVPEKDIITIESIFETRNNAEVFYMSCCYGVINFLQLGNPAEDPSIVCGGEYTTGEFLRTLKDRYRKGDYLGTLAIADGMQNTNSPYDNQWDMGYLSNSFQNNDAIGSVYACIRYCNIFIENIDKVNDMNISEKNMWKAEIQCYKALYYFEMIKRYGPITLIPQNLDPNIDITSLQLPRSHIDTCFNEVVKLFDEAIPYLSPLSGMSFQRLCFFSKEAAYAYKARVLLYAASPLYNGNEWYATFKEKNGKLLFSTAADPKKWERAAIAADEAIVFCESKRTLTKNTSAKVSKKLNIIRDIQYSVINRDWQGSEWIFMQKVTQGLYTYQMPLYSSMNPDFYSPSANGCLGTNIEMVEMFYTENGLPIDVDRTWPYKDRYKMGMERNPEFTNVVNLNTSVLNLHLSREPRFYADIAAGGTYWELGDQRYQLVDPYRNGAQGTESSIIDGSLKQNISGYWVKKQLDPRADPRNFGEAPFVLMRLADLYLMQAEAWNEVSGPSDKVYNAIDKVRERAGIPPMRDAWRQFSTRPDKINNQEGLREEIQRERMIEFAFEGHHFWDLRRWKKAHERLNKPQYGWNILGENAQTFYNNFNGPKIVWNKSQFIVPRDYLYPIKSEEIMIANVAQNPGW